MNNNLKKFILPKPKDLKDLRIKKGLTQQQLAELTNLSQSLIARIENGTVNPRISTIEQILSVLYNEFPKEDEIKAEDVCMKSIISVNQDDSLNEVIELMEKTGISQVPVRNNGKFIGKITEKDIMIYLTRIGKEALSHPVKNLLGEPLPEVNNLTSIKEIEKLLLKNPAVIVKKKDKYYGIITKSDLLKFFKK